MVLDYLIRCVHCQEPIPEDRRGPETFFCGRPSCGRKYRKGRRDLGLSPDPTVRRAAYLLYQWIEENPEAGEAATARALREVEGITGESYPAQTSPPFPASRELLLAALQLRDPGIEVEHAVFHLVGTFRSDRDELELCLRRCGARVVPRITQKLKFLVIGSDSQEEDVGQKITQVEERNQKKGAGIKVIGEADLNKMLEAAILRLPCPVDLQ